MKKKIIFILLFLLIFKVEVSASNVNKTTKQVLNTEKQLMEGNLKLIDLEQQIRGDFRLFLEELYSERERGKKEAEIITKEMLKVLEDTNSLVQESKKEIRSMSYSESKNLLIASIFLWISITIFIIMNLVFANNLKKELYFLRNGLLRSEIKDNMINLSSQLSELNEKLNTINKGN